MLNNAIHAGLLKKLYPQGRIISLHPALIWKCGLKPTPLSYPYELKIVYKQGQWPDIFLIGTKLIKDDSGKLPHVYSIDKQELCLHYPPEKSWTASCNIADTIIPWACEWLFHYEIWLVTGEWNGGGTVH